MKLAVSNIAWPRELESAAFGCLLANDIRAVEVAPTCVWPNWEGIDSESVREFRHTVECAGLVVSSLQSILFQRPELQLFGSHQNRQLLYQHLCRCADLAVDLGACCLVLGAPKNRDRGDLSEEDAFDIATEFFSKTGEYYAERGVCLGFEANPAQYGCNFATESKTAAQLVRAVSSEGFRLHLDIACMHLAGEDPVMAIEHNIDILRHFHASEPFLGSFAIPATSHALVAQALNDVHYDGWVALEMRSVDATLPALEEATAYVRKIYGGGS